MSNTVMTTAGTTGKYAFDGTRLSPGEVFLGKNPPDEGEQRPGDPTFWINNVHAELAAAAPAAFKAFSQQGPAAAISMINSLSMGPIGSQFVLSYIIDNDKRKSVTDAARARLIALGLGS